MLYLEFNFVNSRKIDGNFKGDFGVIERSRYYVGEDVGITEKQSTETKDKRDEKESHPNGVQEVDVSSSRLAHS